MAYSASIKVIKRLKILFCSEKGRKISSLVVCHSYFIMVFFPVVYLFSRKLLLFFVKEPTQQDILDIAWLLWFHVKNFSSKHYHLTIIKKPFTPKTFYTSSKKYLANHNFIKVCSGNYLLQYLFLYFSRSVV